MPDRDRGDHQRGPRFLLGLPQGGIGQDSSPTSTNTPRTTHRRAAPRRSGRVPRVPAQPADARRGGHRLGGVCTTVGEPQNLLIAKARLGVHRVLPAHGAGDHAGAGRRAVHLRAAGADQDASATAHTAGTRSQHSHRVRRRGSTKRSDRDRARLVVQAVAACCWWLPWPFTGRKWA